MLLINYQTTYQTLVTVYHITMTVFYQALADARISDSNWESSIYVDLPPPKCLSDNIPSCIYMKRLANPILYL